MFAALDFLDKQSVTMVHSLFQQSLRSQGEWCETFAFSPLSPIDKWASRKICQSLKQALKLGESQGVPSQQCLAEFLLTYQVTPHSTTNESLSKLLMGRELRTYLDLLHPDCGSTVLEHQSQQKDQHDRHSCERDFKMTTMGTSSHCGVEFVNRQEHVNPRID